MIVNDVYTNVHVSFCISFLAPPPFSPSVSSLRCLPWKSYTERGIRSAIFHGRGNVFNRRNHLLTSASDHNGEPLLGTHHRAFQKHPPSSIHLLVSILPLFFSTTTSAPFTFHSPTENFYKSFLSSLGKKEREQRITNKERESTSREHSKRKHSETVSLHFRGLDI